MNKTKEDLAEKYAEIFLCIPDVVPMPVEILRSRIENHFLAGFDAGFERAKEMAMIKVNEQAEDEGLWSVPFDNSQPIAEAYLQQELRALHAHIESLSSDKGDE